MELEIIEKDFQIIIPKNSKNNFITTYNNDIIYYSNKIIKGYNLFTKKCIFQYQPKEEINSIKVSYNNKYLIVQVFNDDIKKYQCHLINLNTNQMIKIIDPLKDEIKNRSFSFEFQFDLNSQYILFFISDNYYIYDIDYDELSENEIIKVKSFSELKDLDQNIFFVNSFEIYSYFKNKLYYYQVKEEKFYLRYYDYNKYFFIKIDDEVNIYYSFNSLFNLLEEPSCIFIENGNNNIIKKGLGVYLDENKFFVKNNKFYFYHNLVNKIYLIPNDSPEMKIVNMLDNLNDKINRFTADGKFAITNSNIIGKFSTYVKTPFNSDNLLKEWKIKNAKLINYKDNGEENVLPINKFLAVSYSKTLQDVTEDANDSNEFIIADNYNLDEINEMFLDLFKGIEGTHLELRNYFQVTI